MVVRAGQARVRLASFGVHDKSISLPKFPAYLLCGLAVTIGITVALATFFMQGFNVLLPGDPARYELLHIFDR